MVNIPSMDAFACIRAKRIPKRLQDLIDDIEARMREAHPGASDSDLAAKVGEALERALDAKGRAALGSVEAQLKVDEVLEGVEVGRRSYQRLIKHIEGSPSRRDADIYSTHQAWDVHRAELQSFITDAIQRFSRRLGTMGMSREKGLMRNVEREMFNEGTGDQVAREMAKGLRAMDEYYVNFMRARRVTMHHDPNRQFIVEHHANKVASVDVEQWVTFIRDRLDLSKMIDDVTGTPFTRESITPLLREIYESIRSHGLSDQTPNVKRRRALWQRLDETRFFIWKDHAAWRQYNDQFGYDDSFVALMNYVNTNARNMALVDTLGPDPVATLTYMKYHAGQAQDKVKPANTSFENQIQIAYDIVAGPAGRPGSVGFAEGAASFRDLANSVVLGGVTPLALVTDNITSAHVRRLNGISVAAGLPQMLDTMIRLAGKGPRSSVTETALHAGIGLQSIQSSIIGIMRGMGDFDGSKFTHWMADTNFRISGLTLATDTLQYSFSFDFNRTLTKNLGRKFSNFTNRRVVRTLEQYGISEADWLAFSKAAKTFRSNGTVFNWKGVDLLSLPEMARAGGESGDWARRIMAMVNRERDTGAVVVSSPTTRRFLQQGLRPGTWPGEISRTATHLLQWPVTFMVSQLLGTFVDKSRNLPSKVAYVASLVTLLTLAGALVTQFRQVAAGKDPMPWDSSNLWLQAGAVGGGMGLISDFLFREHYGNADNFLYNFAGPTLGTIGQFASLPGRAIRAATTDQDLNFGRWTVESLSRVTPFSSLWFARAAFDRVLFDTLSRWWDEESRDLFRRRERGPWLDNRQRFWWPPGEPTPERAPRF